MKKFPEYYKCSVMYPTDADRVCDWCLSFFTSELQELVDNIPYHIADTPVKLQQFKQQLRAKWLGKESDGKL